MKPVILCVDDERMVLNSLVDQLLHILGDAYCVEIAENAAEALDVLEDVRRHGVEVPVIISDQLMPGMKGDELLSRIHHRYPQALKIFLTGQADALAVGNAVNKANLYRYIAKPWDEADLRLTVTEAIYRYEQEKQLEEQRRLREEALSQERQAKEALRQANDALELRVRERTFELGRLNQQLQAELAERTHIEQELRRAKDQADAANQAKSAFLANMSHELRTPLNAILGFAQLLLYGHNMTPEQREHLHIINRSGEHLLILINQVLDLSKIEAGKMTVEEHPFNIHFLLQSVVELFRLRAHASALTLCFDCADDVPQVIQTDEVKLRQVLINLLNNAIKFTEHGQVSLRVSALHEIGETRPPKCSSPETLTLRFEISDTGIGISPEDRERIFEAFAQAPHLRPPQEGTGLGLAISQKFVQLMGGRISVVSEVGQGSTFIFDIQAGVSDALATDAFLPARPVVAIDAGTVPYRVLVVDDHPDSRQLLATLLQQFGFDVRQAETGREALDVWQRWQPHLAWLDIRLPDQSGYDVAHAIRNAERGDPAHLNADASRSVRTIIIMITALGLEDPCLQGRYTEYDDFLRKPFRIADIFALMHKHLGIKLIYARDDPATAETALPPLPLTPDDLAVVPRALRQDLKQAIEAIDIETVNALLERIRTGHASIAIALDNLVKNYRFDILQTLFERDAPG